MATLIIFEHAPSLPELGEAAQQALHEAFLDDVCQATAGLGARRVLAASGDVDDARRQHLAKSQRLELVAQGEGDVETRLARLAERALESGPVVIVTSNAPTLPRAEVSRALDALVLRDAVVGKTRDYFWLIGLRVATPLAQLRVQVDLAVAEHYGVDNAADLARLRTELTTLPPTVAAATRRALAVIS